jgi:hypothetical protein
MRSLFGFTILPLASICALASCSSPAATQDDLVGEATEEGALADTTDIAADGASTYFGLTADLRRCASPLCGGWFLKSLNRSTTVCHDGHHAATCYAPVLDWSEANLSDAQRDQVLEASRKGTASGGVFAIVRGRFEPTNTTPQPQLGRFVIGEAWVAQGDVPSSGEFVQLKDNGLRCFVAPCPSLTENTLNTSRSTSIAEVNWMPARLTDAARDACVQAMYGPDGVVVAGDRYTVKVNGSSAKGRTATAAYVRLSGAAL